MGVGKNRSGTCKAIQIWRFDKWMAMEWRDPIIEIIDGDQQDVRR
jgi:hypothetical protein